MWVGAWPLLEHCQGKGGGGGHIPGAESTNWGTTFPSWLLKQGGGNWASH